MNGGSFFQWDLKGRRRWIELSADTIGGEVAGPDFEIVTLMPLLLVVATGKKIRMTAKQLTRTLRKTPTAPLPPITDKTDVVILVPDGMETAGNLQVIKLQLIMNAYYPDMN